MKIHSADEANGELVETRDACPGCGERVVDNLVWMDDGEHNPFVECQSCGAWYDPNEGKTADWL